VLICSEAFDGDDFGLVRTIIEEITELFDEIGLIVAQGDDLRRIFFDSEKIIMFMPEFHDIRDMELLDVM